MCCNCLVNAFTITRWLDLVGQSIQQETAGSPQAMSISCPPAGPGTYLFINLWRSYQVGTVSSKIALTGADNQNPVPSAWSWDGNRLASPTNVWDAGTGKLLAQFQGRDQQHTLDQVAWSPDDKRLGSADSLNIRLQKTIYEK